MKKIFISVLVCAMLFSAGCTVNNSPHPTEDSSNPVNSFNPTSPVHSQPVTFESFDELMEFLIKDDLECYNEQAKKDYANMISVIKNANSVPLISCKNDIANEFEVECCSLLPRVPYEDVGISYRMYYKGIFYYMVYYFPDMTYAEDLADGLEFYNQKRFGGTGTKNSVKQKVVMNDKESVDAWVRTNSIKFVNDKNMIVFIKTEADANKAIELLKKIDVSYRTVS